MTIHPGLTWRMGCWATERMGCWATESADWMMADGWCLMGHSLYSRPFLSVQHQPKSLYWQQTKLGWLWSPESLLPHLWVFWFWKVELMLFVKCWNVGWQNCIADDWTKSWGRSSLKLYWFFIFCKADFGSSGVTGSCKSVKEMCSQPMQAERQLSFCQRSEDPMNELRLYWINQRNQSKTIFGLGTSRLTADFC